MLPGRLRFLGEAFAPALRPFVPRLGRVEQLPHLRGAAGRLCRGAHAPEGQSEVGVVRGHGVEQGLGQFGIRRLLGEQAELSLQAGDESLGEQGRVRVDHLAGNGHGALAVVGQQRQDRFRQPREVPGRDARLIGIGVAAAMVDGAEHRRRIVGVHEGAGAIVDGLAGDRGVVGVHHAVDETHQQPLRHEAGLARDHTLEEGAAWLGGGRRTGIVTCDRVVGEQAQGLAIVSRGEELECPDADMAGCDARQHRSWQGRLAIHLLAGGDGCERARGGDPQGRHRLAHEVFPQHRPQCRPPIAVA